MPDGAQWTLPGWRSTVRRAIPPTELRERLRADFGVDGVVLSQVPHDDSAAGDDDVAAVYAIDLLQSATGASPLRWMAVEEAAALRPVPRAVAWMRTWAERAASSPAPPWMRPGWYDETTRRIAALLVGGRRGRLLGVSQLRTSPWSCLLRVEASAGHLYYKAVIPAMAREVRVTRRLGTICPANVPEVIASADDSSWLLMADAGGRPLPEHRRAEVWMEALKAYARLQRACLPHLASLAADGCEVNTIDVMRERLAPRVARIAAVGRAFGETVIDTRALIASLDASLATLHALGPELTIQHPDFHPMNVHADGTRSVFLDWDVASIGHPFCGVVVLLEYVHQLVPDLRPHVAALRDAYLSEWDHGGTDHGGTDHGGTDHGGTETRSRASRGRLADLRLAFAAATPLAILEYVERVVRGVHISEAGHTGTDQHRRLVTLALTRINLHLDRPQ